LEAAKGEHYEKRYLSRVRAFAGVKELFKTINVKSHPTPTPGIAAKGDPINRAETGVAEPQIAKQSRSWRAAIGDREIMRGS
jgi:hypothetical protein